MIKKNTQILFKKMLEKPLNTILFSIGVFMIGCGAYQGTLLWDKTFGTVFKMHMVKIDMIDDNIPLLKIFVIFYYISFAVWFIYPALIYATDKRNRINYLLLVTITVIICFLFFVFYPTYIDRDAEHLYQKVSGNNILDFLLRLTFDHDGKNIGYNLFPSVHCLSTLNCYLGIKDSDLFSNKFKFYTLLLTIFICLSTVFTKQHYILDIFGGVIIPIIVYFLIKKLNIANYFMKDEILH